MNELRLVLRRAKRRPWVTVAGSLTLALGIAASTAAFSAVQGVLVQPLPVSDQEDLVVLWHESLERNFAHVPFTDRAFPVVRYGVPALVSAAAVETVGARLAVAEGVDGTYSLNHVRVAGDFFAVLGVRPSLGRLLDAADDALAAAPVVVVTHTYWVREMGSSRDVLGSPITYGGRSYTLVGVAAPGFDYPRGTDVWATLRGALPNWATDPPVGVELDVVGRLVDLGAMESIPAQVSAALMADPELATDFPADLQSVATPFADHVFGTLGPILNLALLAALLLLTVAVANTVLLLMTGGREAIVDAPVGQALGAPGSNLVARVLSDAALVGGLSALVGVGLAWLVLHGRYDIPPVAMAQALSDAIPRGSLVVLDSGHFPYIEDTGGLTSAISSFLGALAR